MQSFKFYVLSRISHFVYYGIEIREIVAGFHALIGNFTETVHAFTNDNIWYYDNNILYYDPQRETDTYDYVWY